MLDVVLLCTRLYPAGLDIGSWRLADAAAVGKSEGVEILAAVEQRAASHPKVSKLKME